ncbi:MAG TPA: hypothetical protein VFC67_27875 [Prolixibacteraceae bacterium]|nr:hypothetical protein [Prolixibacteraceae bacterium]
MKNLFYLLVVIFIFGCASKKVVTNTDTEQQTSVHNDIKDTHAGENATAKKITEKTDVNVETTTTTTNYDTSKPADPKTGKSPISSESVTTTKQGVSKTTNTAIDTKAKDASTHEDNSKAKIKEANQSEIIETPEKPGIAYLFYILVCIGVIIIVYLVYRYRNWIKLLFWIKKVK